MWGKDPLGLQGAALAEDGLAFACQHKMVFLHSVSDRRHLLQKYCQTNFAVLLNLNTNSAVLFLKCLLFGSPVIKYLTSTP